MKKNMMRRNLHQSIKMSITRYIAIVAIIALGAGIFVGLRSTKSDMIATGQRYMDEQNMFDLRLLSTYGWSKEDVEAISRLDGVEDAEGVISLDVIASYDGADVGSVYKVYSIPENINRLYLHGGRMPSAPDECLVDAFHATDDVLGKRITLSVINDVDTLDSFSEKTFTVVGYASSPLYMDLSRGSTTLGDGSVSALLFLPTESFSVDYYSEIAVTLPGENRVYTDAYHDYINDETDRLEPLLEPVALSRFESLKRDADTEYHDGLAEYEEGLAEYELGKSEVESELQNAKDQLLEAEKEIEENRQKLADGLAELEKGQGELDKNAQLLNDSRLTLAKAKADSYSQLADASAGLIENYKSVSLALSQVEDGISQIDSGVAQIDSGISQLESGLQQLETMISITETLLDVSRSSLDRAQRLLDAAKADGQDGELIREIEAAVAEAEADVAQYEAQLAQMQTQYAQYSEQLAELQKQRQELASQKAELEETKRILVAAKEQLDLGFTELQASQTRAENEFRAADAEIESAELQLKAAQAELDKVRQELEDGQAQLAEGEAELAEGWAEYEKGEAEAWKELADAESALVDAKRQLDDAKESIDSMEEPTVFCLGRTANAGYLALESNSDIVEGVSKVFPAFFLLIAALVCITTMTRMVEEERTQIGTLKALGYGNGAIIGKYLAYAGSAAVVGCGLGVIIGSIVFPLILWQAYQILILLGDYLELKIDWPLCLAVVGMYTAVTLLVTWYCSRRSLREVPAELIRPKPPTTGKKIFLEKLRFWNRLGFLNKVMLRNIFRYRQRLLMMLVGIGGCTSLLLTGFGLRDSISELANNQYSEIVLYDVEVRFSEDQSQAQQTAFEEVMKTDTTGVFFYHQSSMELEFDSKVQDITFLAADSGIAEYMSFHQGKKQLSYPGAGEALISVGLAEKFGISVGDKIFLRDSELRVLQLRVSGVFDNNVNSYVVTDPSTLEMQWEQLPEIQMAAVSVDENMDAYEVGAKIADYDGVMNVTVSQEVKNQVGKMLEALDLVVITVVICAGLLAVTVLYNLTNINITERIREIATIKVLGFNSKETAAYVFKENLLLSAMGCVCGLGGGVLLLRFVISQIKVDLVWITPRLLPLSFVLSLVITMLSAVIVDFILYFRLEKVNMAEALKSVE